MPKKVPVDEVIRLTKQGYSDSDIAAYLRDAGYSPTQINDALNQAKIKLELAETAGEEIVPEAEEAVPEEVPAEVPEAYPAEYYLPAAPAAPAAPAPAPAPAPEYAPAAPPAAYPPEAYPAAVPGVAPAEAAPSVEAIEEIAEGIISEKWEEFKEKVGDIGELKAHMESRLNELNDRVKRLEIAMDRLHAATLGKVEEYGKSVKALGSEVRAVESTLSKIMQPLVGSVKELRAATKEMKKAKPAKPKKKK